MQKFDSLKILKLDKVWSSQILHKVTKIWNYH